MTFRVMTLSIKGVYGTLSLSDTQHKRHSELQSSAFIPSVIMLKVTLYFYYAECLMLSVIILNVFMLSTVMLSVVAP